MACRAGDTLVVISLDRLARSVSDARDLVADLAKRGVILHLGGSVHDPSDPLGPVLEMVADFQTALVRGRTAEGMRLARTRGRLKGRPPSPKLRVLEGLILPLTCANGVRGVLRCSQRIRRVVIVMTVV